MCVCGGSYHTFAPEAYNPLLKKQEAPREISGPSPSVWTIRVLKIGKVILLLEAKKYILQYLMNEGEQGFSLSRKQCYSTGKVASLSYLFKSRT